MQNPASNLRIIKKTARTETVYMLKNLHQPDVSKSTIRIADIDTFRPFPAGLEYSCPSRGSWTIAHTPMIIPGSYMIYIGAAACLRGVVLSAAEYEGLDRFSMVLIEEKDILSGNMEELFIEGITDILNKLPKKPSCVLPFTGCIHYFLATDMEYVYDELKKRFPDIDFMSCRMTPTMKENDYTPEEDMRRSMYSCIDPLPEKERNQKAVNLIGDNYPIAETGDHLSLLIGAGYRIHDPARMRDYSEYKRMGESRLNIYSLPVAGWACEYLKEKLGQDFIHMPYTYNFNEIEDSINQLANILGIDTPDFSAARQKASDSLKKALTIIGNTPIVIDYLSSPRFLSMAQLLIEHGFNVTEIYGDVIPSDDEAALKWLKRNNPDLLFKSAADFRARFYPRGKAENANEKMLAIGQKAAFFSGSDNFVNIIDNNGLYGYDGISKLADAMIDAFMNKKDTRKIIQVKGWGCSA